MKQISLRLFLLLTVLCLHASLFAQVPRLINYQGVARKNTGEPLANQALGIRLSLTDASANVLYRETHTATTNNYGLYSVQIGAGTPSGTGLFASIEWVRGDKELLVEIDPAGGTSYTAVGASQKLVAVPYALHANAVQATSNGGGGLQGRDTSNLYWGFYEADKYRGYVGSYAGKNEDVDFGTGGGNVTGNLHLTIQAIPKLTIDSIGRVGIGTRAPRQLLTLQSNFGDGIDIGNISGWTAVSLGNSLSGTFNAIANGGTYLSFLYMSQINAAPVSKMVMDGSGNSFRPTNDNVMSLGAGGYRWTAVWAANGTIQTSDERYKTDIRPLTTGLSTLMQLHPISYAWKDESLRLGTGVNYGFSAQELYRVAPDLVIHSPTMTDAETGKASTPFDDTYGVKYAEMTPILVKAIQEQQAVIEQLKQQVSELKQEVALWKK